MQVLIYQAITASKMKQVKCGKSCCKARPGARWKRMLLFFRNSSERKVVPPVNTVLSTTFWHFFLHEVLQGVLFPTLGSAKRDLGHPSAGRRRGLEETWSASELLQETSCSWWCLMQLIVWLVLLAWCERGGWRPASEGFWESYGTAWTLSAKIMEGETAQSLLGPWAGPGRLQPSLGVGGLCSHDRVQRFTAHEQHHMEWGEIREIHG